jgi:hypothetical protein
MYYRYQNLSTAKYNQTGSQYYLNNVYPDIPFSPDDNYVITVVGDRLDLLALDFYGDDSLWWVIVSANGLPGDSIFPPIGIQLRIPINIQSVVSQYKITNQIR